MFMLGVAINVDRINKTSEIKASLLLEFVVY